MTRGVWRVLPISAAVALLATALLAPAGAGARAPRIRRELTIPKIPKIPKVPKIYHYSITYDGRGTFSESGDGVTVSASFHWQVTHLAAEIISPGFGPLAYTAVDDFGGSWSASVTGNPPCMQSGALAKASATADAPSILITPAGHGSFTIAIDPILGEPAESPSGGDDCSDIGGPNGTDFWHDWPQNVGVGDNSPTGNFFTGHATLTPAREGKVIENVSSEPQSLHCPSACSYSWTGTIKLTRVKGKH